MIREPRLADILAGVTTWLHSRLAHDYKAMNTGILAKQSNKFLEHLYSLPLSLSHSFPT